MSIIIDMLRRVYGVVTGERVEPSGDEPETPPAQEPLSETTVAAIREMLSEHDRGIFLRTALLADLLRRDADLYGALLQRVLAFQALPTTVVPLDGDESGAGAEAALEYSAARDAIISPGTQVDMLIDAAMMGFAVGQKVWVDDPLAPGGLALRVKSWPAADVEYDRFLRWWFVRTLHAGRLPIEAGSEQWVIYTPRGARAPWLWGAVRSVATWAWSNQTTADDARKRSEVYGNPIWKAMLPAGGALSTEGKRFASSVRGMGRNAVIPCPQGEGGEKWRSYDVELVEAKADAHAIFDWLMRTGGGRIRLVILGQDLTSQNNVVGTNASSTTGMTVTDRVIASEAKAWGVMETEQIAVPRARFLGTPAVRVRIAADDEDDRLTDAQAQTAVAASVAAWKALGVDVDVDAAAAAARVPVRAKAAAAAKDQGT